MGENTSQGRRDAEGQAAVMGGMVVSDKGREPWLGSRRSFLSAWAIGILGSGGSDSLVPHACALNIPAGCKQPRPLRV